MGHWCRNCNKSLKAMGFDKPRRPITTPKPPQETKVVIVQKSSGVWKVVGVLLVIVLILVILGMLGL